MSDRPYLKEDVRDAMESILAERGSKGVANAVPDLASHELHCSRAKQLGDRMDKIEREQKTHGELLAEFVGAQKLQRWLVPVATSALTGSLMAAVVMWMLRR